MDLPRAERCCPGAADSSAGHGALAGHPERGCGACPCSCYGCVLAFLRSSCGTPTLTASFSLRSLTKAGLGTEITFCSSHHLAPRGCRGLGVGAFIAAAVIYLWWRYSRSLSVWPSN